MHQSELSAPECEDSSMTCGGSEQSSFRFERHMAGKMDIKHANYMSQCPQLKRDTALSLSDKENCSANGFQKSNLYRQLEGSTPSGDPATVKQRLKSPPAFDSLLFHSATSSQEQQNRDITIIKNFTTTPPSEVVPAKGRPQQKSL